MSLTRLILLSASPDEPSPYLVVDPAGMVVTRGSLSAAAPAPPNDVRTVLIVPGQDVTARWLTLKAVSQTQAASAAAMMLADDLAAPRESLHVALAAPDADGERLVCIVGKARMQALMDQATALGAEPDVVLPDYLVLPEPEGETLRSADMGGAVAVRGKKLAFTAERDLVPYLAGDRPFEAVFDPSRMEAMLAETAAGPPINLRQGPFAVGSERAAGWREWRRAAALAGLVLISPLILWGAQIARESQAARAMENQARKTAAAIVGEVSGDPVLALRARASQSGAADRFLDSSAALFEGVARLEGASLQAFAYQADGSVRATLVHGNYTDVEGLTRNLELAGFSVREDAAVEAGGQITTDLTIAPLT
jgi:general secretion pathway protein L